MERNIARCLAVAVLALLAVGVASGTVVRHLIQVIAPAIALVAVRRGFRWGAYAALPLFAFWLAIMALIWLYLAGWSEVASGTYSPVEIVLTLIIGAACATGIGVFFTRRPQAPAASALAIAGFAALQLVTMWLSFHPAVSRD